MSVFVQDPPGNKSKRESKAPWLGMSILFHGLLLGWLIYLVPPKELATMLDSDGHSAPAAATASTERVQAVAREINQTQADEIRSKVEELLETDKKLSELQDQTQKEFFTVAGELAMEAPAKIDEALADVKKFQDEALAAMTEAEKFAQQYNQTPDEATAAQLKAAQERAKNAQATATTAQEKASQQLGFLQGGESEAAHQSQTAAAKAQAEANRKQDAAAARLAETLPLKHKAGLDQGAASRSQHLVNISAIRVTTLQHNIAILTNSIQEKQNRLTQPGLTAKDTDKFNTAIATEQGKLAVVQRDLDKANEKLDIEKQKAASAAEVAAKSAQELQAIPEQVALLQAEALQAQTVAGQLQGNAQTLAAKATATQSIAQTPVTGDFTTSTPVVSLDGKSFEELYNMAVETERQISARFQTIRSAQVAVQRQIPIAEAQKYVQLATPERNSLNAFTTEVSDAAGLEAKNRQMETALRDVDSMVALARGMAYQANNSGSRQATGQAVAITAEGMKLQAQENSVMTAVATDNQDGSIAADLTEMMKAVESGESFLRNQGQGGAVGAGQNEPSPTGLDAVPGQGPMASGTGPQGGVGVGTGNASSRGGIGAGPRGFPSPGAVLDSIPGRKVYAAGTGSQRGSKWMYVDSWYVIGPFPNPQRRNLDTKFPPESVVDLDATYPVDGGTVHWQFIKVNQAAIRPPHERSYAIYYAYTTLWFDEERDMWIAVGSDDYSKMWINDMPVWASGPKQKTWKANEGYRKVHFKKGLNRILYRVENGQASCMFSLMLNTQAYAE